MRYQNSQTTNKRKLILISIVFAIFATLLVGGMNKHPLWGDEADTAFFAKTILQYGIPKGWDGSNLIGYRDGKLLNDNLLNNVSPWAQYYTTSISFFLFGVSTFSARLPAVIFALLSFYLTYKLTQRYFSKFSVSWVSLVLMSVSIPYILYSFQSRYYSLSALATLLILYSFDRVLENFNKKNLIALIMSAVLLFYCHHLQFIALWGSIFITSMLLYRSMNVVRIFIFTSVGIAFFTLPWLVLLNPASTQSSDMFINFNLQNGIELFLRYLIDFNHNMGLPLPLLAVYVWLANQKNAFAQRIKFILLFIFTYLILISLFSIQAVELTTRSDIRYAMNLYPLMLILLAVCIIFLYNQKKIVGVLVFFIVCFTNLFSLQFPVKIWLADYVGELTNTAYLTPMEAVVNYVKPKISEKATVLIIPQDYNPEIMNFYLNKTAHYCCRVSYKNLRILENRMTKLPKYIYDSKVEPDWIILLGAPGVESFKREFDIDLSKYQLQRLHVFSFETSRPELFIHTFSPVLEFDSRFDIFIYQKT